ncbi:hypothetical protein [Paenibacillus sp. GCM10023250]|uniref:hypothetical protein n=1 Tax=Paenibacillus sp. GCM10023250 TaxID=3252648 RepID=UPI00360C9A4F
MAERRIEPKDFVKMQQQYGHVLVDEAVRQALISEKLIKETDASAAVLVSEQNPLSLLKYDAVIGYLDKLSQVGKPLTPAPEVPGGQRIIGEKIGIQGNPPWADTGYAGGWHFSQSNGWDAWFTVIPIASGGFRIANPACRLTGSHGPAIRGGDTYGQLSYLTPYDSGRLLFHVSWDNGTAGTYQDTSGLNAEGHFFGNAGGDVVFEASKMPKEKVSDPAPMRPVISCEAAANQIQDGFNVTMGGAGFGGSERYELQGRVVGTGFTGEWGVYAEGETDGFGRFAASFGIIKPLGQAYVFRALGQHSGYTQEIGIS